MSAVIDVHNRSIETDRPSLVEWTLSQLRATPMTYFYLAIAIVGEVTATSVLKSTQQFSRPGPTAVVAAGYLIAFYAMSLALKTMPVGVARSARAARHGFDHHGGGRDQHVFQECRALRARRD
jgi:Small Multidrug Resistance protein